MESRRTKKKFQGDGRSCRQSASSGFSDMLYVLILAAEGCRDRGGGGGTGATPPRTGPNGLDRRENLHNLENEPRACFSSAPRSPPHTAALARYASVRQSHLIVKTTVQTGRW